MITGVVEHLHSLNVLRKDEVTLRSYFQCDRIALSLNYLNRTGSATINLDLIFFCTKRLIRSVTYSVDDRK
jgi:hypothetical protein